MKQAKQGDIVKIYFIGQTEDGDVFQAATSEPLEFAIGNKEVLPGLEKNVIGMEVGEKKKVKVLPEDAFGERRAELVDIVKKSQFPEHLHPEVGQQLQIKQKNGKTIDLRVTNIKDELVTLDANHPLAGHTLKFEIELADLKQA